MRTMRLRMNPRMRIRLLYWQSKAVAYKAHLHNRHQSVEKEDKLLGIIVNCLADALITLALVVLATDYLSYLRSVQKLKALRASKPTMITPGHLTLLAHEEQVTYLIQFSIILIALVLIIYYFRWKLSRLLEVTINNGNGDNSGSRMLLLALIIVIGLIILHYNYSARNYITEGGNDESFSSKIASNHHDSDNYDFNN